MRKWQFPKHEMFDKILSNKNRKLSTGGVTLKGTEITRPTLGRIPMYLRYLRALPDEVATISATTIAKDLGLGEVQVRKDLGSLCDLGKPKVGYPCKELIECLESLFSTSNGETIIIGAGRLGKALLDYGGFDEFGISVLAAFDEKTQEETFSQAGKPILPMNRLGDFCKQHNVKIGIIAVPSQAAQSVCNQLYENGIKSMWCFAPCRLYKPADADIRYENMALSLAYLKMQIK